MLVYIWRPSYDESDGSMTQEEIDTLWQKAMQESIKDGEMFTRYHFAKLVAKYEREAIQDEYWMRVNSDLENGVKSLNEKAAERFTTYFPELSTFGSWLEARGEA